VNCEHFSLADCLSSWRTKSLWHKPQFLENRATYPYPC